MALGVPFGNYRLVRRLARGGMAEVFLAWQTSAGPAPGGQEDAYDSDSFAERATGIHFSRQVAVKRILPHLSESDEFRALFLQEARLAASLSHPNVVHIYDFGRSGNSLFLAMELIEGCSLAALLRAGPLPVVHAVRIASDALSGLHHAHTRVDAGGRPLGIVHRDVSPSNLMITPEGVVKLLDFGIAKAAWSMQLALTRPGVVRGKYAYMSPEQAEGQALDARSDVYAVGVCLFEMLTGRPLLPADLPLEAALLSVRGGLGLDGLGQMEILRPDVPGELMAILRRALQTRREQRHGSAAELQLDLERFLKGWSQLSSALLLGEYVREQMAQLDQGLVPRPDAGPGQGDPGQSPEMVTPVMLPEGSGGGSVSVDWGDGEGDGLDDQTLLTGATLVDPLPGVLGPGRGGAVTVTLPLLSTQPRQGYQPETVQTFMPEASHGRGDIAPLGAPITGQVTRPSGKQLPRGVVFGLSLLLAAGLVALLLLGC
jgi:serine/threonine-protein kinase